MRVCKVYGKKQAAGAKKAEEHAPRTSPAIDQEELQAREKGFFSAVGISPGS